MNYDIVKIENIKNILKKFKKIDFIKIDIEGSEYKILPEIIRQRKKINKVVCEMHKNISSKESAKIYKLLKKHKLINKWFYYWI